MNSQHSANKMQQEVAVKICYMEEEGASVNICSGEI